MAKKWVQAAIKHPGALHRQLGIPAGHKIPAAQLAAAAGKGGVLGRRARLAQTLRGFAAGGMVEPDADEMMGGNHDMDKDDISPSTKRRFKQCCKGK